MMGLNCSGREQKVRVSKCGSYSGGVCSTINQCSMHSGDHATKKKEVWEKL
jgi:hypothetical protein